MLSNRVLSIRVSGKERKEKIRKLLFDLAHTKNLLIILIRKYKDLYGHYPSDQSILYGLIAEREYFSKKEERLKKFQEVKNNILKNGKLTELLKTLKEQKKRTDNNYLFQQVIRGIVKSFSDYRKAYREYQKNSEKFKGIPSPPKPKKLKFLMNFSVELNVNTFKQLDDSIQIKLRIHNKEFLKVKLPRGFNHPVKSIRLKIFGTDIFIDTVYKIEIPEGATGKYKAGIDLGLNNLIALISTNPELKSFIVSGKEIKAFNQWFNKKKAKLQSEIDTLKGKLSQVKDKEEAHSLKQLITKRIVKLKELSAYRKRKLNNDFHKISRKLIDLLVATEHKKLYIGKGATESKDEINIGKKNNQHFVSVPFRRLIELIKYKAEEAGIEVKEIDEAFTSKTSPLADILEVRKVGQKYLEAKSKEDSSLLKKLKELRKAVRRSQGLLKCKVLNRIFNADLVGAYNIARVGENSPGLIKNLKLLFIKLCNPVKMKLIEFLYKVSPESFKRRIGSSGSLSAGLSPKSCQVCVTTS